jgi:hypothetical protein
MVRNSLLPAIGFLLAIAAAVLEIGYVGIDQDAEYMLHYAALLLRDPALFRENIQVNTPIAILVFIPSAAANIWLHLSPGISLHSYVVALCGLSLFALHRALKSRAMDTGVRRYWLSAIALILLVIPLSNYAFAEREHLFFVFALPWILLMLLGFEPTALTSTLAAIGFGIKPYNILLFAALQLFGGPEGRNLRQRILSQSTYIICGIHAFCWLMTALFLPNYIFLTIPLALTTYSFLHTPTKILSLMQMAASAVLLLAIFPTFKVILRWLVFLATTLCIYYFNNGWEYTHYLLSAPLALVCYFVWGYEHPNHGRAHSPNEKTHIIATLLFILLLTRGGSNLADDMNATKRTGFSTHHADIVEGMREPMREAAGSEFILLSTTLWNICIEALSGPRSVSPYEILWPMPWLYHNTTAPEFPKAMREFSQGLLEALVKHPRATLIIDTSPVQAWFPSHPDIIGFLRRDRDLAALLSQYTFVTTMDYCAEKTGNVSCRFDIWRRTEAKPQ